MGSVSLCASLRMTIHTTHPMYVLYHVMSTTSYSEYDNSQFNRAAKNIIDAIFRLNCESPFSKAKLLVSEMWQELKHLLAALWEEG